MFQTNCACFRAPIDVSSHAWNHPTTWRSWRQPSDALGSTALILTTFPTTQSCARTERTVATTPRMRTRAFPVLHTVHELHIFHTYFHEFWELCGVGMNKAPRATHNGKRQRLEKKTTCVTLIALIKNTYTTSILTVLEHLYSSTGCWTYGYPVTSTKPQRGNRNIYILFFFNLGARWGRMVNATPGCFIPGNNPISIV